MATSVYFYRGWFESLTGTFLQLTYGGRVCYADSPLKVFVCVCPSQALFYQIYVSLLHITHTLKIYDNVC